MSDAGDFEASAGSVETRHSAAFGPKRELDELVALAGSFRCAPTDMIGIAAGSPSGLAVMLAPVLAVDAAGADVADETIAELSGSTQDRVKGRVLGDQ